MVAGHRHGLDPPGTDDARPRRGDHGVGHAVGGQHPPEEDALVLAEPRQPGDRVERADGGVGLLGAQADESDALRGKGRPGLRAVRRAALLEDQTDRGGEPAVAGRASEVMGRLRATSDTSRPRRR